MAIIRWTDEQWAFVTNLQSENTNLRELLSLWANGHGRDYPLEVETRKALEGIEI